jgi:glycosyltransferase involved in cell wall biosynthesis
MLEQGIEGELELEITVRGYAHNIGEPLGIELGDCTAYLLLTDSLKTHVFRMRVGAGVNFLAFNGVSQRAVGMDDPRDIGFGLSRLRLRRAKSLPDSAGPLLLDFSTDELETVGFHQAETAGAWTAESRCTIYLQETVAGDIHVRLELFHLVHNDGREIEFQLGNSCQKITLSGQQGVYELVFRGVAPTHFVRLDNLGVGPSGTEGDQRQIGLGVASIAISAQPGSRLGSVPGNLAVTSRALARRRSASVLYTAILNPNDGRKNWEDIITAFVYALRDKPGATLLVKIANENLHMFFEDIFTFFMRLHPFQCRVVFIHGYLSNEEYQQLIAQSQYIVNASRGEGQCLPLMEFMSSGVPAIAPKNTAMLDYIDDSNAFVVESTPELAYWPHDPRPCTTPLSTVRHWSGSRRARTGKCATPRLQHRSSIVP